MTSADLRTATHPLTGMPLNVRFGFVSHQVDAHQVTVSVRGRVHDRVAARARGAARLGGRNGVRRSRLRGIAAEVVHQGRGTRFEADLPAMVRVIRHADLLAGSTHESVFGVFALWQRLHTEQLGSLRQALELG